RPDPSTSYALSLHDALPISSGAKDKAPMLVPSAHADVRSKPSIVLLVGRLARLYLPALRDLRSRDLELRKGRHISVFVLKDELRSEEHTSELQSPDHLVCRL